MKPGSERTLFCLTDLKEGWTLKNLSFGEVLAILASRPRAADVDLLFWTEEWSDWKGLDDTECLPFRVPRVETQTPPPVPLVPILMSSEPPMPSGSPSAPATPVKAPPPVAPIAAAPAPATTVPVSGKKSSRAKRRDSVTETSIPVPKSPDDAAEPLTGLISPEVLPAQTKAPSLSELLRTQSTPKLSVNPEFQGRTSSVEAPAGHKEPGAPANSRPPDVLVPPVPTPPVKIPQPIPVSVAAPATELKPTAPPKLVTPSGKVVPPPPGFAPPLPPPSPDEVANEVTPPPDFGEETRAPVGHRSETMGMPSPVVPVPEERGERTEVTSVQPMDRPVSAPRPRENSALRKFERFTVQMPVIVQTTTEQFSTWTLDISEGGVRIKDELPDSFAGYSQVVLMPKNRAPFHLLASMVEDQADGRFHLQFMDSPAMAEFIAWMRDQSFAA